VRVYELLRRLKISDKDFILDNVIVSLFVKEIYLSHVIVNELWSIIPSLKPYAINPAFILIWYELYFILKPPPPPTERGGLTIFLTTVYKLKNVRWEGGGQKIFNIPWLH